MAVTSITRDFADEPQIVRVVTTDDLRTITTAGYLTAQAANILNFQHGAFQWLTTDYVLIAYNGGEGFFLFDALNLTFIAAGLGTTQVLVTSAQIKTMYTTPVLMIPSPGVGKQIIVGRIVGTYLYGGTQYTGGGAIGLEWGSTAALAGPAASTTLAGATFDAYAASNNFELTPDNTDTLANIANKGVYLSNDTAVFATGNGTLLMSIDYKVALAA